METLRFHYVDNIEANKELLRLNLNVWRWITEVPESKEDKERQNQGKWFDRGPTEIQDPLGKTWTLDSCSRVIRRKSKFGDRDVWNALKAFGVFRLHYFDHHGSLNPDNYDIRSNGIQEII